MAQVMQNASCAELSSTVENDNKNSEEVLAALPDVGDEDVDTWTSLQRVVQRARNKTVSNGV